MLKEVVEKGAHLRTGNHVGKQAKDPLSSVNVRLQVELLQPLMQLGQIGLDEDLDDVAVFEQSRKLGTVYFAHVTVLNQRYE